SLALRRGACRLCDRAAALPRRAAGRAVDLLRLPGAAVDPLHPPRADRVSPRAFRLGLGTDPHVSDLPRAVLHLAADGLFPHHSVRARGARPHRRPALRAGVRGGAVTAGGAGGQVLVKIMLPLPVPGLISAGIFAFTLSWNEFIY